MKKTKLISIFLVALLSFGITANVLASGVNYLPDVTGEMSNPYYWSNETELLMT